MEKKYKTRVLNFRVDEDLHAKLKGVSIASRMTISELITTIIRDHIDEYSGKALMDQLGQLDPKEHKELIKTLQKQITKMYSNAFKTTTAEKDSAEK